MEWSVHPPEAGLSLPESHPPGARVSMEIQCTIPVILAGAEAEGGRQKATRVVVIQTSSGCEEPTSWEVSDGQKFSSAHSFG